MALDRKTVEIKHIGQSILAILLVFFLILIMYPFQVVLAETEKVYSEISISQLEQVINNVPNIFDVEIDGDVVTFKYQDQDRDTLTLNLGEIDDERLVVILPFKAPNDNLFASLLAVDTWNQRKDTHGTFAYVTESNDESYFVLESHLMLRGGIKEENIRLWFKNFINKINPYENHVILALKEINSDKDLQRNSEDSWESFWRNAGNFVGGVAQGFLEQYPFIDDEGDTNYL